MKHSLLQLRNLCLTLVILATAPAIAMSAESLPAEKAGTIGKPQGKIAFIREGNVWVMTPSGANQELISKSLNANGRLTWSPDGKKIAFTRSGNVNVQAPDNSGGLHKLYDLFVAYIDSAHANNLQFWYSLTGDMGSRGPEYTADGTRIIFWKDVNANNVNALQWNYQIYMMDSSGGHVEALRHDRQGIDSFLVAPSMNANGDIACVAHFNSRMQGLVVLPKEKFTMSMDSVTALALKNPNCVAPAWSPDGKWLAYVNNSLDDGSLYITTADLKEQYLVYTPPPAMGLYTVAPSFSPDSKWLTFSTTDGSIWICDITGNGARRLTGPGKDKFPAWSKTP